MFRVVILSSGTGLRLPIGKKGKGPYKTNQLVYPPESVPECVSEALRKVADARDYLAGTGQKEPSAKDAVALIARKMQLIPEDEATLQKLVEGASQVYHVLEKDGFTSFFVYRFGKWQYVPADRCIPIGQ